jgi:hypothetical protein
MSGGGDVQDCFSANAMVVGCFIRSARTRGALRFYDDAMLLAEFAKFLSSVEWMHSDLVDSRHNAGLTFKEFLDLWKH